MGLVVSIACLVSALWGIDWGEVRRSFGSAKYSNLVLLTALLAAFYWLKAWRWRLFLQPMRRFRTPELVPAMMIGFMGNNVLPAHLGEFVRVWVLGRQTGIPKASVLSTVVLERVFDLVVILALLGLSLMWVPEMPSDVRVAGLVIAGITLLGVAMLLVYIRWTPQFVAVARWNLNKLIFTPARLRAATLHFWNRGPKVCRRSRAESCWPGSRRCRSSSG